MNTKSILGKLCFFLVILIFIPANVYPQSKIWVNKYIVVKEKNKNRFEIVNISKTRLGIVLSHRSDKVFLDPGKTKSFTYKNCTNASTVSLYYTREDWEAVRDQLVSIHNKNRMFYGFAKAGDEVLYTLGGRGQGNSEEVRKRKQGYNRSKNYFKAEYEDKKRKIIERLKYYGHLYDASHGHNGRYLVPIQLSRALSRNF